MKSCLAAKLKDIDGIMWLSIETSLKVLKECSRWNPILFLQLVGVVVACIELVGKVSQNQQGIADLTDKLRSTASVLKPWVCKICPNPGKRSAI